MAGTYLNFPFDAELFDYLWQQEVDNQKTAILDSGAMVEDANIAGLISNGSNIYTAPIYTLIGGTPDNYDGATNITTTATTGKTQSGVVFGRAHAWSAIDFVKDFNSGADPMMSIVSQLFRYWQHQRQAKVVGILGAVLGCTPTDSTYATAWALHATDISSTTATIAATNRLGATTIGDACVKACGDNADAFTLAIMHSAVANNFAGLQLVDYGKYTDVRGIERPLQVGFANGRMIVVDDGVPTDATTVSGATKYTTYLLGEGVLRHAFAPVDIPAEVHRDPKTDGGMAEIINRVRETIHPNGCEFNKPTSMTASPTDAQLFDKANWDLKIDPKGIAIAKVVSNV